MTLLLCVSPLFAFNMYPFLLLCSLPYISIPKITLFCFFFVHMQQRKCKWLNDPPLVGDSTKAFPNIIDAYVVALRSHANCIGVLFAFHDRQDDFFLLKALGFKTLVV